MNTAWKWVLGMAALVAGAQAGAVGRLVDLKVYDCTSQQELPVYRYDGRYYIAGQPGHRYQIQLHSRGGGRVLGVLSVDGVNVVSGNTADWSQTGYVLDPFVATEIRGWRKSLSEVADFVFADASRSYAARTGRPDNVGVIGMAVFRARPLPTPMPVRPMVEESSGAAADQMRQAPAASAPAAKALSAIGGPIGTGHGARETSVVSYTDFERASATPDDVVTLYYDTRERLIAQGIIPSPERLPALPDPFPGHFVPDPR
ncbi:hypothetical protein [Dyella sp. EPa41]|uniref:hypothetical protein n=1 Tax=Dyella sp. EPa41 TaxID=1561194 RepID=UPI0019160171|nr:hypothetical protein [Dyella sp. EPa41]